MSDVQRFEIIDVTEPGSADMAEHAEGDWVLYDDYKALESRLGAALGRLGLQQDENGASYDEIDRLQMSLADAEKARDAAIKRWQIDLGHEIAEREKAESRLGTCVEALECLLPGLTLDLRYAEPDDDTDAMRSRIRTVQDALVAAGTLDVRCGNANCNALMSAGEPHVEGCLGRVVETSSPIESEKCPNALTPDGPVCPRCGGRRGPSGVDGGSWVHY